MGASRTVVLAAVRRYAAARWDDINRRLAEISRPRRGADGDEMEEGTTLLGELDTIE